MKLLIYTPSVTSRVRYIFIYLFDHYLQINYTTTNSVSKFTSYDGIKFSYAPQPIGDEPWVWQHPFVLEETIEPQLIKLFKFRDASAFFGTDDTRSLLPFDLFAASFYLMTRYEEYLPFEGDHFGRFKPKNSIAFQGNFINKPVVNKWIVELMKLLYHTETFSDFSPRNFSYLPTYDIDHAFKFRHKGFYVNLGGMAKNLLHGEFDLLIDRMLTLLRLRRDAYDTYGFMFMLNKRFKMRPHYFILCAAKRGKYDRNLSLTNKSFRRLLIRLGQHGYVGLHPSFAAGKDLSLIASEKESLEAVLHHFVAESRQHYLLLSLPNTYRALGELNINNDYTMGYAGSPGFRASVCTRFIFFDLLRNEETDLVINPLTYMDGSFNDYMSMSPKEAATAIKGLIDEVKAVRGEFISLWHNNALSNTGHWRGWRAVYYNTLEYAFRE